MLQSIEAMTSYISKYRDNLTSPRQGRGNLSHTRPTSLPPPSPRVQLSDLGLPAYDPPPYGDVLPPPSYRSAVGGLSLVDRADVSFKIYHRDLVALNKEWARRRQVKGDFLATAPGGPHLAPNRIENMRDVFMSIIHHQPCSVGTGTPRCDCRSVRWAHIKEEWLEIMFLLGNLC